MKLKLDRLKENSVFMRHLRFDVTPEIIFKPRFVTDANKRHLIEESQGFMFYVEGLEATPSLMMMKTYNLTSKTIGEVQEVPVELLKASIEKPASKPYCGMYPIGPELEAWIKSKLAD